MKLLPATTKSVRFARTPRKLRWDQMNHGKPKAFCSLRAEETNYLNYCFLSSYAHHNFSPRNWSHELIQHEKRRSGRSRRKSEIKFQQ